jgi:hypothetical protein
VTDLGRSRDVRFPPTSDFRMGCFQAGARRLLTRQLLYVLLLFLPALEPIADTPACPDPTRSEERLIALKELADRAMDMVRMIHAQAQEAFAAGQPVDDLRFTRVTRAVRQIFALEAHLEDDQQARIQREAARRAEHLAAEPRRQIGGKQQSIRGQVEPAIQEATCGAYAVILQHRLYDWLDRRGDSDAFLNQPIDEIIAAIRRDIGLDDVEAENAELEGVADDPTTSAPSSGPEVFNHLSREDHQGHKGHQGLDSS